ncbi:XRE family transcriptional regulator [Pseudomonas sp. LRF_L74]|uniref:XRE family transcriptional regulator n=1 Tax=Pseudomonas sp. LRF_L74 TaxID=3369422 RepID=UPI003F613F6F
MDNLEADQVEHEEESAFIERLRVLIARVGSANALAKSAGVSQSGFQRYLAGGQPTRRVLIALARAARVDLLWLMTGEGRPDRMESPVVKGDTSSLTLLPMYKGRRALREEDMDAELPLKPETLAGLGFCRFWLSKHGMDDASLAGLYMSGQSMEPTISNGDTVLVNITQRDIVDGDIYALRKERTVLIKRVQNDLDGHLRLISDNPIIKPIEVDRDTIDVIGRVVWRGSLF